MVTRYERVVLDLEDRFTTPMAKAAAATHLMDRELKNLDGTTVKTSRTMTPFGNPNGPIGNIGKQSGLAGNQIDRLSGRLRLFGQMTATLGPGLIPIGAIGIPAVTGLAAQFGAAALAGGTAIIAFQGVGDALKTVNEAALEPTTANIEAARLAMEKIGPEAQAFVLHLHEMIPALKAVRDSAAGGLFPGVTDALEDMERLLPRLEDGLYAIGVAVGNLAADSAESLAGPRWAEFFDFIATTVPQALAELGQTVGNLAHGMAELWMAFTPINNDFSSWMLDVTASFDSWAQGLAQTEGFREFVDYLGTNGPKVADAMGALANAVLQIVEAAAPLGGPVLQGIEAVAKGIAVIANSDLGTPIMIAVAALSAFNRVQAVQSRIGATAWAQNIKGANGFVAAMGTARSTMLKSAGVMGALGVASMTTADGLDLSNTAMYGLMGTMAGPWGAAAGAAIGLTMDLSNATEDLDESYQRLEDALSAAVPNDLSSMNALSAQIVAAQAQLDEFRDNIDGYWTTINPAHALAGWKNDLEGVFGTSDVDEYEQALAEAEAKLAEVRAESSLVGASTAELQQAMDQAARAAFGEAGGMQAAVDAMRAKREEAARALNAELNYKAAILDARDALKANGKTVDENTRKGQDNLRNLYALAEAWNGQSDGAKNATGSLKQARGHFIATAVAMDMPIEKAKQLARRLFEIPERRIIKVDADTTVAEARVKALKREMDSIDRNVDIYFNAHTTRLPSGSGMGPQAGFAGGGLITGPGGPRDDLILALLSNREFVMPADAVEHYGLPMMEMLRAKRLTSDDLVAAGAEVVISGRERPKMPRQLARAAA